MNETGATAMAGRPREFDYDHALEQAMRVFWCKGYEGTSMPDLTAAMGMNRPSIYAAFGNKEQLFQKALERYSENSINMLRQWLDAPTVTQSIERFLAGLVDSFSSAATPRGCFAIQGALVGGADASGPCKTAAKSREVIYDVLFTRLRRGVELGDLPQETPVAELARFYLAVMQGMAVQSVSGASQADLKAISRYALKALPA